MTIVIDAYNILKYIIRADFVTEKERLWFISLLSRYAQTKKHKIVLVFDGGSTLRPTTTKRGSITIIYSGDRYNADTVIKNYITQQPENNMLLVSSDRALGAYVSQYNIPIIDAAAFYLLLKEKKSLPLLRIEKTTGCAQKLETTESSPEIDALMQEGSNMLMHKNEQFGSSVNDKQKKINKLSKEEKKLVKITKKL